MAFRAEPEFTQRPRFTSSTLILAVRRSAVAAPALSRAPEPAAAVGRATQPWTCSPQPPTLSRAQTNTQQPAPFARVIITSVPFPYAPAGHYDTISQLIALATTPAGGPSIEAFTQRVAELGFYLDNNVFLRVDPLGACLVCPLLPCAICSCD